MITQHEAKFVGRTLRYSAEVGRIPIREAKTGEPHASIFYTAYRMPPSSKSQPVTLAWNGGPGSPSTMLHIEADGPLQLGDGRLIHNPDTWITASDLVFVNQVGTGYSRPAQADYADEFCGTAGDVASITEFVRAWRLSHDAEDIPAYLARKRWAAGLAASVVHALLKRFVPVDGLVLISGGCGLTSVTAPEDDLNALRVANLAATALFHHDTPASLGATPDQAHKAAELCVRQNLSACGSARRRAQRGRARRGERGPVSRHWRSLGQDRPGETGGHAAAIPDRAIGRTATRPFDIRLTHSSPDHFAPQGAGGRRSLRLTRQLRRRREDRTPPRRAALAHHDLPLLSRWTHDAP